jgi:flagellar basal-body rod protein FlgB
MVPDYDSLGFAMAAVKTRGFRHQILASNLVNADTPAYAARDIDFAASLRSALGARPLPAISATHDRHITQSGRSGPPELLYRIPAQPAVDGNTVDPDVERAHFADNTLRMELAMMALSSTIRSRQIAFSGQA